MSKNRKSKGEVMEQKVDTPVVTEGATELDTSVAQEGEATGESNTPVVTDVIVESETATTDEAAKLTGLGADFEGEYDLSVLHTPKVVSEIDPASLEQASDDTSSAVGLEDLDPQVTEEDQVKHYVDPVEEYSVFARSMRDHLREYVKFMAPNYPVAKADMLSQQASLSRCLTRILNNPDVIEFQEAMDVLVTAIKANPQTFSARYINRGMDNVTLSAAARKQFETIMFIIPLSVLSTDGVTHYHNYGPKLGTLFPDDATGAVGNRLQSWMKRYLSIE